MFEILQAEKEPELWTSISRAHAELLDKTRVFALPPATMGS